MKLDWLEKDAIRLCYKPSYTYVVNGYLVVDTQYVVDTHELPEFLREAMQEGFELISESQQTRYGRLGNEYFTRLIFLERIRI